MYPRLMNKTRNSLDALIAALAPVRDDELAREAGSPAAAALLVEILGSPTPGRVRRRSGRRRTLLIAFAALLLAALLSFPAFGVEDEIVSLFAGWRDPEAPVPTRSDVLIASGTAGAPWKIVATRSDQGLCLGLFHRSGNDRFGAGGCGYTDVRGDLPRDIRGDPALRCVGPPTTLAPGGTLVPCGSLPRHWIGPVAAAGDASLGLDNQFVFGPLANDVASVELILTNGQRLDANIAEQPEGLPLNFYWAAWPADEAGPAVRTAVAFDSAGRVLERRVPGWNRNPTGDPDGPPPPAPLSR
jgi:MFS family permease